MSTEGMDPQKLLRKLSSVASSQESGEVTSRLFQKTFGQVDTCTSSKHLATNLIHLRSLHDAEWEVVTDNLKEELTSEDPDVQLLALETLTSLPVQYLVDLVLKDGVADFVVMSLDHGSPELRAAGIAALGHLLLQLDVIKGICHSSERTNLCCEYWRQICDSLVDSDEQAAGTAFSVIRQLMRKSSDSCDSDGVTEWSVMLLKWCDQCFHAIHQNLTAVLSRSDRLDAAGRVCAVEVAFRIGMKVLKEKKEETAVQKTTLWALPSIMLFLERQLSSADVGVIHQSAACLLQLCSECLEHVPESWSVSTGQLPESYSSKAMCALENLLESKESVPARGDLILTMTKHLTQLEISETCAIARRLQQKISGLPRSSDRTRSLMHLWRAALRCDLETRRIQHSRGEVTPGASLQSILESPFFSGVVAGNQRQGIDFLLSKAISKASYPAYKQELVSSLMEVMMEHVEGFELKAIFPENAGPSPKDPTIQSAIQSDLQTDVIDWFAASVVALYLTQACLGWDNVVAEGYYGLTLPADLWLQVLQLTSQTLYTILAHYNVHFLAELQSLDDDYARTKVGKILKVLAGEAFEIQKLMKRMVFFWSFLNAALKPRVFWIVCHHIELPDKVDDIWNYLVEGLKDLLIIRPTEIAKRQREERMEASRQGSLAPQNSSVYVVKTSEDAKQPAMAFNQSEVALEGMTAGLVCLSKLAEALLSQYQLTDFHKSYHNVCQIAELLKGVCNSVLDEDFLTVDMFDQCKSVLKQLDFITEHPPEGFQGHAADREPETSGEQDSEQNITFLPIDLSTKQSEGFPFTNSVSLGLFSNKRSRRHGALTMNLQNGRQDAQRAKGVQTKAMIPPVPERPSAVDLAAAVGGLNMKENETDWKILTGQGDPIQLSIRHQVEPLSRALEVEISAENKMGSSDITGVVVSFAIEGPVAADREGLIAWYPEKLPAKEPTTYRFELTLTEFGAIEIQPFMDVALQETDEDMPSLSCKSYTIPLVDLLAPLPFAPSAKFYFQEVSSWPESLNTTAVCRWPGTNGAMQLLSALNQSHLKRIWPASLQALAVFQAVYLLQTFNGRWISFSITGQLADLQKMGLAAWAVPSELSTPGNTGYYLCKCTFASTSPHAIAAIRAQTSELLSVLSGGGLVLGLDPGVGRPPPPPPIHPNCYVDLGAAQHPASLPDLQSLALTEWKRLNRVL